MDSPLTNGHRNGTIEEGRDSGSPKVSPRKMATAEAIREWLVVHLSEQLGIDRCEIDICEPFASYGLSSSGAAMLSGDLNEWLQIQLSPTMAWEYPTIDRLARYLADPHDATALNGNCEPAGRREREPVAIIGMGCRFPGAANPESFWQLLQDGRDAITEVPAGRWQESSLHSNAAETTHWGGFLPRVDLFDPQFFGISPREGARMDPQQRLLLEVAWEALENAGKAPDKLAGSSTGIFVGISNNDYRQFQFAAPDNLDAYAATGNAFSIAANRLSYFLDLKGPSLALDTACSSSLVAVHMACRSLRMGECDMALAGGVNLILSPELTRAFSKAQMMAADGRCKTFDASADGYVRGEGCGIVVLKLLSDALWDGDSVVAVVKGSAVNQDGRSNGLTAPHGPAQQAVVRQAMEDAGVTANQISYVEAHGTGTALGDPIEVQSLWEVLKENRLPENQCAIGSVKTNIGHLEAAAGIAGLMKAALCLQHRRLTPHLHLNRINPRIPLENMALMIPTSLQPWTTTNGNRIAGVSSFGFGGTNAHVILEEAAITPREKTPDDIERPLHILSLSTQTENSLLELCIRYANHLDAHPELPAQSVCFTANTGRAHFGERLTAIGATSGELSARLRTAIAAHKQTGSRIRKAHHREQPKIAFLYTGQGSQYAGMARELFETQPAFRKTLETCDEILRGELEQPLLSVLYPPTGKASPLDETTYTQPALFALQCALTELWRTWGIRPDAVMGHSVGAYAAAYAAGVFGLEEGLRLIAQRARLIQSRSGEGQMAVVLADEARVTAAIHSHHGQVSIAAINGPRNTVISGEPGLLQTILESLKAEGIVTQLLSSSRAFHSPFMEPVLDPFEQAARQVQFKSPSLPFISDVTGMRLQDDVVPDAGYWRNHLRATIQFAAGIETLSAGGHEIFLEIGPTPSLLAMGKRCVPKDAGIWLPSLKPGQSDWTPLLESLGELYVQGVDVDWAGFDREYRRDRVSLPTYPFERQRYWMESSHGPNGATAQNNFLPADNGFPLNPNTKEPAVKAEIEAWTVESQAMSQATASRRNNILGTISGIVARLLGLDLAEINIHAPLLEMGADSLVLLEAVRTLEKTFGVHLTIRQMFEDLTTLGAIATYIDLNLPPEVVITQQRIEKETPPTSPAHTVTALHAIHGRATSHAPETPLERIVAQQLEVMSRVMLQQLEAWRSTAGVAKSESLKAEALKTEAEITPRQEPVKHAMAAAASFGTVGNPAASAPRNFPLTSEDTSSSHESRLKTPDVETVPLTASQKNLWLLEQMGQAKHDTIALKLQGPLHLAVLRRALQKVAERHDALRTQINPVDKVQEILPGLTVEMPLIDFSDLDSAEQQTKVAEWLTQENLRPFALASAPLWRANVLKTREQKHILVLTTHHILIDGWSIGLIVQEMISLYTAECTAMDPQLPSSMRLAEYVQWQLIEDNSPEIAADERYWMDRFSRELPVLELPTDYPRPAVKTYEGARESLTLDANLSRSLKQLSKQQGCTLFMTLLAGYLIFLHRTTCQDDIVLGFPVSGRYAPGSENLVAYCAHLVPVRSSLKTTDDGNPAFIDYLAGIRETLVEAYEHQAYPLTRLIEKLNPIRNPGRSPIVNTTFNIERSVSLPAMHGLTALLLPPPVSSAEHELDLNVTEVHDQLLIDLVYNTGLFNSCTVRRMLGHYENLLRAILANPERKISILSLLTDSERQQLLFEWNNTRADYSQELSFHHLFEIQAEKSPHGIALIFADKQLTYRQLDQQSNRLAHYLRIRGVGPEVRVGICVERSPEMVVALFGVLKAGGAYLPLDPGYPAERMRYMLEDAQAAVVVTQSSLLE
ncbi:MAG TPA: beta-ketoacyl synthase N-terminal-like domain-containing protein, partial [Candidatus Angelobacter sp.]|nr:beta-ketoacyl synthase N-terminal-like domain-containing protein [Candidatus Angelobacter sp.]